MLLNFENEEDGHLINFQYQEWELEPDFPPNYDNSKVLSDWDTIKTSYNPNDDIFKEYYPINNSLQEKEQFISKHNI